jgi:RNA polymerase sigma factor (TIGR02999 family)
LQPHALAGSAHFFAVSAQMMRRVLVDYARRQNVKRGGGLKRVSLDEAADIGIDRASEFVAIDDALNALAEIDPRKASVVELRFFGGLSVEETAETLKLAPITVIRDWNMARAWLYRELSRRDNREPDGNPEPDANNSSALGTGRADLSRGDPAVSRKTSCICG